ncbi:hypothetical protein LINPERHAP1_LOCUS31496 [Linum perenne]
MLHRDNLLQLCQVPDATLLFPLQEFWSTFSWGTNDTSRSVRHIRFLSRWNVVSLVF